MNNRRIVLVVAALLLCSPGVRGEIYKCTDAHGTVRYSDQPCEGKSTIITPRVAPQADGNSAERMDKTRRLLRAYQEEHAEEQRRRAEQQAEKEQRQRNCANARDRLRQYTQASRLYQLDEGGNRVILSDEERRRATENARAEVARWCG
jgi:hypothetical protein